MIRLPALIFVLLLLVGCRAGTSVLHAQSQPGVDPLAGRPRFDGARAFSDLSAQCAFGPRVPNTPAHERCLKLMVSQLQPLADKVAIQDFDYTDKDRGVTLHLTNVLAVFNPNAKHKIMLCAHWDSRPTADQDFDLGNRNKPIPGADDGASGVAVLLELAKVFKADPPAVGVVLAFWDAEDWGPDDAHMYVGARYFAKNPGAYRPDQSILIDMIGQKNLSVPEEVYSRVHYPQLVDMVWTAADDLGYSAQFPRTAEYTITDDHIPLSEAGIPSIDLIDFDYAYWHTLQDTPDHCDPASLVVVGRTLEKVVYDQAP